MSSDGSQGDADAVETSRTDIIGVFLFVLHINGLSCIGVDREGSGLRIPHLRGSTTTQRGFPSYRQETALSEDMSALEGVERQRR